MRRFVGLLFVVFFALPLGLSVAGCGHAAAVQYCNGSGFGPTVGQVKSIVLASTLIATGESLNYGQIGAGLNATAEDCNGGSVSVSSYTYATSDPTIADINPRTGSVCGGTWNRNTGGGIADYTVCTPPTNTTRYTALITASGNGAVSNAIQVFIHPTVTSVVLGPESADCSLDPASFCVKNQCNSNSAGTITTIPVAYDVTSCLSQNQSAQLTARVYANTTNISCEVGPVALTLQGATNVATISAQGLITADQPGSALVTATVSNSSSAVNAGLISTCPPSSIVLSAVGQTAGATSVPVALNTPQSFTAVVKDKNNTTLTGVDLEFNSTLPVNFPTSSSTVTPIYPGSATITAVCQPPSCNPSPFSQIGYLGNGTPVTSNGITVTAPGTSSDVLYMGSTGSQYLASEDFTTGQLGTPLKLPYTPTSMVISQDGTSIYMGSAGGLMIVATASGALTGVYQSIQGNVLAVAPNDSYVVVADSTRQTVSLITPTGTVFSTFNGIGTRAQWTPDSNTLYVTTNTNQLLTYTTFVGWESTIINQSQATDIYTDVAVTVPNAGAYFASPSTDGRSDCPSTTITPPTTINGLTSVATTSNVFSPLADRANVATDRLAFTTDGKHLLGATVQNAPTLQDIVVALPTVALPTESVSGSTTIAPCPQGPITVGFFTNTHTAHALTGVTASSITGVVPASNSTVAAVTYTGSGGVLPLYAPAAGAVSNVALSGGATTAPVAGVFSTDNNTFYTGSSGDNVVHIIKFSGTTGTDSGLILPALPGVTSGTATPNLIVLRARRSTS